MLRPYQQRAIDELYAWFRANPKGNLKMSLAFYRAGVRVGP